MKFCPQCGAAQNDNVAFCSKCGSPLGQTAAQNPDPDMGYNSQPQNQGSATNVYVNQGPAYNPQPIGQLPTDRNLIKFLILSLITCGIYDIFWFSKVSTDINVIASRYDGKNTMHFCLMSFVLAPITCGIYALVWYHGLSERIGNELARRGINYDFGANTFWLWNVLGSLIVVGPFIYLHKLCEAMNLLSADYNQRG